MSKLIKLSDAIGYSLSKRAEEDGLTMAAEVAKLLAISEVPPHPTDTSYFDKKFDELKGFIVDNLVDAVAGVNKGAPKTILKWAVVRELFYEKLDWDSEEWCSERMCEIAHEKEGLDLEEWYIEDGFLKSNWPGEKAPSVWLKVSPEVEKFLEDKMKG